MLGSVHSLAEEKKNLINLNLETTKRFRENIVKGTSTS